MLTVTTTPCIAFGLMAMLPKPKGGGGGGSSSLEFRQGRIRVSDWLIQTPTPTQSPRPPLPNGPFKGLSPGSAGACAVRPRKVAGKGNDSSSEERNAEGGRAQPPD